MTPRSLFTILLKIMGLYLVMSSIQVIPELFTTLFMAACTPRNDWSETLGTIAMAFLIAWLYFVILRYCLFKTDRIIDKLALDKHFAEERFELNIHRSTVLSIGIIVIGALTFIESFPMIIEEVYNYFGEKQFLRMTGKTSATGPWTIFYVVKTVIGYVLMTNSCVIVNYIERERKQTN